MDKFGIFKLLNSFLSQNQQNSSKNNSSDDQKTGLENLLSAFQNNFSKQPESSNKTMPTPNVNQKVSPPLQSAMLNTMSSHDAFIKRVKQKSQK